MPHTDVHDKHIAVPSRLSHPPPSPQKPLSGLRFGVKDVIDIAGLETGCGSADYRAFYPPRTKTAACIQRLVDAGAVMVGKMRCCQWCDGQDPMERYVLLSVYTTSSLASRCILAGDPSNLHSSRCS